MRLLFRFVLAGALSLAFPLTAAAQGNAPRRSSIPLRAYAAIDLDLFNATKTFDATLGTSHLPAYGGGADLEIWKHVFVRAAATHLTKKGSRVFVDGGTASSLNIPLTVSMTPVELGGGWRFVSSKRGMASRLTPFVGGAAVIMQYKETSKSADASENTSKSYKGGAVFGGLDVGVYKWIDVGGEVGYRFVPNAIGLGGASKEFNEKDLGGLTVRLTIGIRIGR